MGSLAGRLGAHEATLAIAWAALVGIALAFVDIAVHRLPDRLIAAGLVGSAAIFALAAIATAHDDAPGRLVTATLLSLAGGLGYLILVIVSPRGMGLGDAKLAVLIGFVTGWFGAWVAVYAFVAGVFLSALCGIALVAMGRINRREAIAHGPFMLLGALAAILWLNR